MSRATWRGLEQCADAGWSTGHRGIQRHRRADQHAVRQRHLRPLRGDRGGDRSRDRRLRRAARGVFAGGGAVRILAVLDRRRSGRCWWRAGWRCARSGPSSAPAAPLRSMRCGPKARAFWRRLRSLARGNFTAAWTLFKSAALDAIAAIKERSARFSAAKAARFHHHLPADLRRGAGGLGAGGDLQCDLRHQSSTPKGCC
jgi:hypothetical protein